MQKVLLARHMDFQIIRMSLETQAFLMKVYYPINGGNYIIQEYTPNDGGLIVRRVYDSYSKTWTMKKVVFS
jgi:hypothetical protein